MESIEVKRANRERMTLVFKLWRLHVRREQLFPKVVNVYFGDKWLFSKLPDGLTIPPLGIRITIEKF